MIVENLGDELTLVLSEADEIWIAVALIKDQALEFILDIVKDTCQQHFLVGIDLPTDPSVLRTLQKREKNGFSEALIFSEKVTFHPKLYLIRTGKMYTLFIGSANMTEGGFNNNIELSYKIINQEECLLSLFWFNNLFKRGLPLSNENIEEYEKWYNKYIDFENKSHQFRKKLNFKNSNIYSFLDSIDFTDRYFKKEHHFAFRKEFWLKDNKTIIEERDIARERMVDLHESIYPYFKDRGIDALKPNPMKEHLISMIRQIDPSHPKKINALWLSYGKSEEEIKEYQRMVGSDQKSKQTFIHHARLQIRLDLKNIGIWLLFAKENDGGLFDRDHFKNSMKNPEFKEKFFKMLTSLDNLYFISVGGERKPCTSFISSDELHTYCRKDDKKKYFIIGKDYNITDTEMSNDNLPNEVLKIFSEMYPFYELMRHKF